MCVAWKCDEPFTRNELHAYAFRLLWYVHINISKKLIEKSVSHPLIPSIKFVQVNKNKWGNYTCSFKNLSLV